MQPNFKPPDTLIIDILTAIKYVGNKAGNERINLANVWGKFIYFTQPAGPCSLPA